MFPSSMKLIRKAFPYFLTLCLVLGALLPGVALPAHAAEKIDIAELSAKLANALDISPEVYDNYFAAYAQALPTEYEVTPSSTYLTLGGDTAAGYGSDGYLDRNFDNSYANRFAAHLGVNYINLSGSGLRADEAVDYINGTDDPRKSVPTAIAQADLITVQIDSSALLASGLSGELNWSAYIDDPEFIAEIHDVCEQIKEKYADKLGKTADSVAQTLEYTLYEYVSYSCEIANAVQAIRQINPNATVLLLGMYNPLRNLGFIVGNYTVEMGEMIDQMIDFSNVLLLDRSLKMDQVTFVDISATSTPGFGEVTLDTSDAFAALMQLAEITQNIEKQHADQDGHDYILNLLTTVLRPPCKHPATETLRQSAATCKAEGNTGDTVCTSCGQILKKGASIPKTGHTYGEWIRVQAPTCTKQGQDARTCTVCLQKETRPVNTLVHVLDSGTVTVAPGADTAGTVTYRCTNSGCSFSKNEIVPPLSHALDGGTITQAPDCVNEGVKTYTCTHEGCTYSITEPISALGHTLDGGTVTTAPDCEHKGVRTYACVNPGCQHAVIEEISEIGHAMDGGTVTTAPTCETDGVKTYACTNPGCAYVTVEAILAHGHTLGNGTLTKEPDCEHDGIKTYICTNDGCTYTEEQAIPAHGHSFGEYASNKDATCQKEGTKSASCTVCGATDTLPDPAAPMEHSYERGTCVYCQAKRPTDPAIMWIVVASCVAVVLLGGICVAVVLRKKKR